MEKTKSTTDVGTRNDEKTDAISNILSPGIMAAATIPFSASDSWEVDMACTGARVPTRRL